MAQVKGFHFDALFLPVHPGQRQQIPHKGIRPPNLTADIAQVFVLPNFLLQHLRIGGDHRQRRLQLMAGVGYKLLLPHKGFFHRPHHAADQQPGQQGQQNAGGGRHQNHGAKGALRGQEIQPGVQHQQFRLVVFARFPVKLRPDPAAFFAVGQNGFRHFRNLLVRIQIRSLGGPGRHRPVLVQSHRIGVAQFRGGGVPSVADFRWLSFVLGPAFFRFVLLLAVVVRLCHLPAAGIPVLLRHCGKGGFRLSGNIPLGGQVDGQYNPDGYNHQHGNHQKGHPKPKTSDHASSSREYPSG